MRNNFSTLSVSLLFLHPFFWQTLPGVITQGAFLLGFSLIMIHLLFNYRVGNAEITFGLASWIVLATFAVVTAVFHPQPALSNSIIFLMAVILAISAQVSFEWFNSAISVLIIYSAIHASATMLFYIFPGLYSTFVKPWFFAGDVDAWDYRSALTSHYSFNAMFSGIGMIAASSRALFSFANSRRNKVCYGLLAAFFLITLILTTKRGHFITAVIAIVLTYLFISGHRKYFHAAILGVGASAIIVWAAPLVPGIQSALQRVSRSLNADTLDELTSGRVGIWQHALSGWSEAPFFGHGWGAFQYEFPNGAVAAIAHNEVLNLLFETGMLGLSLFLIAALTSFVQTALLSKKLEKDSVFLPPIAFSLSLQLFLLSYSLTTGELLSKPYTFLPYFIAVSISYAVMRRMHALTQNEPSNSLNESQLLRN